MSRGAFDFHEPAAEYYEPMPRKSRLAYILLALFFGGLGVHNFYAGRTTRGLMQLVILLGSIPLMLAVIGFLTVWIPPIWALWDIVAVNRDGDGRKMA